MHKFKGEYGENNCNVKLEGKEPYFLINLEKYCHCKSLSSLSHCDFIYTIFDGDKIKIFIVELKDVNDIQKEEIGGILNDVINNKFPQTLRFLLYNENHGDIVNFFNIRNAEHYGVLVLPYEVLNRTRALFSHFRSKFASLRRNGFKDGWISQCGESIWNRHY